MKLTDLPKETSTALADAVGATLKKRSLKLKFQIYKAPNPKGKVFKEPVYHAVIGEEKNGLILFASVLWVSDMDFSQAHNMFTIIEVSSKTEITRFVARDISEARRTLVAISKLRSLTKSSVILTVKKFTGKNPRYPRVA